MRMLKTYKTLLTVDSATGLLAQQTIGAVVVLDITVTADAAVFSGLIGPAHVTGKVVGVEGPEGAGLLLRAIGLAGTKKASFSGDVALSGATQELPISVAGIANARLAIATAPGMDSIAVTGLVDVIDKTYEWFADNVKVSGTATLTSTEEVPDAPVTGTPGQVEWVPRQPGPTIRGYMGTDLLADTNLVSRHAELVRLRSAFTHLLVTADLQVPKPGQSGDGWMRPYVGHCRTRTELTDLGKRNIALLHSYGFQLHLILLNTWALKHGYSENIGSVGRDGVTENNFASDQLQHEKQFIDNLLADPVTGSLDGIMPCLEAATAHSGAYCLAVAKMLREANYGGTIIANVIGEAKKASGAALKAAGVLLAPSLPDHNAWVSSENDVRNSDGMMSATPDNTQQLAAMVRSPGPKGYYVWVKGTVGSNAGRGTWPDAMLLALGATRKSAGGDTVTPPPASETPEQKVKRLYPGMSLGSSKSGGNYDASGRPVAPSNTTIWKPASDGKGKLVIVCGHDLPRVQHALIMRGTAVLGKATHRGSVGNSWRLNLDGEKAGAAYGNGLTVVLVTDAGNVSFYVAKGGSRLETHVKPPSGALPPVTEEPGTPPVVVPPVVAPPAPPDGGPTQGALFFTTPNSITLRDDFAAVVGRIDALATIHETSPGVVDMTRLKILTTVRSGNTWTLAEDLSKHPVGNRQNTWRIRLVGKPPAGVTYHTSIAQSFVRVGDNAYGPGNRTYPPSIRA